jgi:cyclic dehypoxanthinyl futalosine synthase
MNQGSVESILEAAIAGRRLTNADAVDLLNSNDLLAIGAAAHQVRMKKHPDAKVTYIVDRNINYTNICESGCRFCAFYRTRDDEEAYTLTEEELDHKIEETKKAGGNQILLQGGLHPDYEVEWYEAMISRIKERHGVHIHGFSGPEIVHIAKLSNLSIGDTIVRLRDAGLDSIPGGGAEILVDRVRDEISPQKCDADEWIEVMRQAHKAGISTTATMMFGHEESIEERVFSMTRIRALQDETGGFTAFIPWPFQPDNTAMENYNKTGGHSYLMTLATSRLYLDNIDNIQSSWVTQGAHVAQVSLLFGANDMGSTMLEENVVAAAGVSHSLTEKDIRRVIEEAGFSPQRRTMAYTPLK